jgi:hypothetical protein
MDPLKALPAELQAKNTASDQFLFHYKNKCSRSKLLSNYTSMMLKTAWSFYLSFSQGFSIFQVPCGEEYGNKGCMRKRKIKV